MNKLRWLLILIPFIAISSGLEEDCLCKSPIEQDITEETNIPIMTFMHEENYITIKITFDDKDGDRNMDFITVKQNIYKIKKIRETEFDHTESFNLSASIQSGWTNMNMHIKKSKFSMKPFINAISIDFPIRQVTIMGNNVASCDKGTPAWKISKGDSVAIPLNGITRCQISITASKLVTPIINMNYKFGKMSKTESENGVIPIISGSPIAGFGSIYNIENKNGFIVVAHQEGECAEQIAFLKLQAIIENITAISLDEDYILTLEPNMRHLGVCEASKSNMSGAAIFGFISASIIILLLVVLIIISWKKRKNNANPDRKELEDQIEVLPMLAKSKNSTSVAVDEAVLKGIVENPVYSDMSDLKKETLENCKTSGESLCASKELDKYKKTINQLETKEAEYEKKIIKLEEERAENEKTISLLRSEMLWNAANRGDEKAVQNLLSTPGIDVNYSGYQGFTPLGTACINGYPQVVKKLLEAKANIEDPNKLGMTPLHTASWKGFIPIIEELLKAGVNVNSVDSQETLLFAACKEDRFDVVQKLLEAGADTELSNNNGGTPLHVASYKGYHRIVQKLLEYGASRYAQQVNGETPLMIAQRRGQRDVVTELQKHGLKQLRKHDPKLMVTI